MAQGGDYFKGEGFLFQKPVRKAMNTFFCSTEKPFKFLGRINEDVNAYITLQNNGQIFLTIPFIQMNQVQTQKSSGGLTEIYLSLGTYVKSFYTVICAPSCTKIRLMGRSNRRLHHSISWDNAVPLIIREEYKK